MIEHMHWGKYLSHTSPESITHVVYASLDLMRTSLPSRRLALVETKAARLGRPAAPVQLLAAQLLVVQ
jgi:hypothetical protein